jgi:hypothetical protein
MKNKTVFKYVNFVEKNVFLSNFSDFKTLLTRKGKKKKSTGQIFFTDSKRQSEGFYFFVVRHSE